MTQYEKPETIMKQFLMGLLADTDMVCGLCHRLRQLSAHGRAGTEQRCLLKVLCSHCRRARSHNTAIDDVDHKPTLEASMLLLETLD